MLGQVGLFTLVLSLSIAFLLLLDRKVWAAVMMRVRKGWWKERRGVREKGGRFSGRQFAYH